MGRAEYVTNISSARVHVVLLWAGVFVDLCDGISAELHYHRYFSLAVQRVAIMLAKAVG